MFAGVIRRIIRTAVRSVPDAGLAAEQAILDSLDFSPETVLRGYLSGFFPMPDEAGRIRWRSPAHRAVLPIDGFHVPKSVRRMLRQRRFDIRLNTSFDEVIKGCAARDETWITPQVMDVYRELNSLGAVRTVESWQNGELVGGCYGISIGRFFACESQFFRVAHAGKVAHVTLFEILRANGYELHDCQYMTPHLAQFGASEMTREEFRNQLARAVAIHAAFESPSRMLDDVIDRTMKQIEPTKYAMAER